MNKKIVKRLDKAKVKSRRRRHDRQWRDITLPPRDMWTDTLEREMLRMRF